MHLSGLFYLERRGTPSADEYDEALRSRYFKYGRYRTDPHRLLPEAGLLKSICLHQGELDLNRLRYGDHSQCQPIPKFPHLEAPCGILLTNSVKPGLIAVLFGHSLPFARNCFGVRGRAPGGTLT